MGRTDVIIAFPKEETQARKFFLDVRLPRRGSGRIPGMGRKKGQPAKSADPSDRRRFERVSVAPGSKVYVTDAKGARLGKLRMIARGEIGRAHV